MHAATLPRVIQLLKTWSPACQLVHACNHSAMSQSSPQYLGFGLPRLVDLRRGLSPYHLQQPPFNAIKRSSNTTSVLAVVPLFLVGGFLLCVSGFILVGTVIGLVVTTPLFVIFSPILVPAGLTIALGVAGLLIAGAFGITALSSLSWILNYFRGVRGKVDVPQHLQHAERKAQETAGHMGQKTQETAGQMGHRVKEAGHKAQEAVRT